MIVSKNTFKKIKRTLEKDTRAKNYKFLKEVVSRLPKVTNKKN